MILLTVALFSLVGQSGQSDQDFFESKIRPIFAEQCWDCHRSGGRSENGLALDRSESAFKGGVSGPAIIRNKPSESLIIKAVERRDGLEMPPDHPLSEAQVASLREWISRGAAWPSSSFGDSKDNRSHWSFAPIRNHSPPIGFGETSIDAFLDASIVGANLVPAATVSASRLLRRMSFGLIGLPPTPVETERFESDVRSDRIDREADRLLASPRYAERWARHWLDLVRFAESNGFEYDMAKPHAYVFRDYVIESLNEDIPFNQFVFEHIAGDLIRPRVSADGLRNLSPAATAGLWFQEMIELPMDWEVSRAEEVENQIDVMGKAFMGLTLGCARCHDHKFDPITTADYYSLAGSFMSSTNTQQCFDTELQKKQLQERHERTVAIRAELEQLEKKARDSSESRRLRRLAALQIRPYLLALRECVQVDRELIPWAEIAQRHRINLEKLKRWHQELSQSNSVNSQLWAPWLNLLRTPHETFAYRMRAVGERLIADSKRWPSRPSQLLSKVYSFEESGWDDWTTQGEAFGPGPDNHLPFSASGYSGRKVASSYRGDNGRTGRLVSPRIRTSGEDMVACFRIAGGRDKDKTCARVILNSESINVSEATVAGDNTHRFRDVYIPLFFDSRDVMIEIIDDSSDEPWGHIMIDDFAISRIPRNREGLYKPISLNALLLRPLWDRAIETPEGLADAYQTTIVRTIDAYTQLLDQNLVTLAENQSIQELSDQLLNEDEKEVLTWAMRNDSLLLTQEELLTTLAPEDQQRYRYLNEQLAKLQTDESRSLIGISSIDFRPRDIAIQHRGNPHQPKSIVPRGQFSLFPEMASSEMTEGSGRLKWATWMASDNNPLTPRVAVNRVWQHHFGQGLVRTPDDFGSRGELPTHPDLLDFLSNQFISDGWSLKNLHRTMVTCAAYRRDSKVSRQSTECDPDNRKFARFTQRRLDAECIVDSIHFVAANLDERMYGVSDQTPGAGEGPTIPSNRRAIYWYVRRNWIAPFLIAFDFPLPVNCVGRRANQVSPQQSLMLMNNERVAEQAERLARMLLTESSQDVARIRQLYLRCFSRVPTEQEIAECSSFLTSQMNRYRALADTDALLMSWRDLVHVILISPEFQFAS